MKQLALFIFLIFIGNLQAQISFKTGSPEMEKDLNLINTTAKADLEGFSVELSQSSGLSLERINKLLKVFEPAEVVLAKDISIISKKPIDDVIKSYEINKEKGWGAVAKEMGIKPGSKEFHLLKNKLKDKKGKPGSPGKSNSKGKGNKGNGKKHK